MAGGSTRNVRSGFTLIEMMVVIFIIAVLAGIAVLRLDYAIPRYELRGAAREVAAIVKQARTRAATTGRDVYVQYDLPGGEYWILAPFVQEKEKGEGEGEEVPEEIRYEQVFRKRLPERVEFVDVILGEKQSHTQGRALVRFSPFGSANHHIVNLKNGEGDVIALKLNGITGAVTFYDHRKEADELLEDSGP